MPTYEYQCDECGLRFERWQGMNEAPVTQCPDCSGKVNRLISGGSGFILKGGDNSGTGHHTAGCAYEKTGKTCCGRSERCSQEPCGGES